MITNLLMAAFVYCMAAALLGMIRGIWLTINNKMPSFDPWRHPGQYGSHAYTKAWADYDQLEDLAIRRFGIAIMHLLSGLFIGLLISLTVGSGS